MSWWFLCKGTHFSCRSVNQNQNYTIKTNDTKNIKFATSTDQRYTRTSNHQHQKLKQRRITYNQSGRPPHHHQLVQYRQQRATILIVDSKNGYFNDKQMHKPKTTKLPVTHNNLQRHIQATQIVSCESINSPFKKHFLTPKIHIDKVNQQQQR